ncbi:YncE family protein, partial [Bacillus toyonensis]
GSISGFSGTYGIAITPDGLTAYVSNANNSTVSIVNLISNSITDSISGFNRPFGIAITPDGLTA